MSSTFSPAARASTQKRDGSASTTLRHWRPIEPVEPRMARRFKTYLFSIPEWCRVATSHVEWVCQPPGRIRAMKMSGDRVLPESKPPALEVMQGSQHQLKIVPDHGQSENKRVNAIEHPAMARQKSARILCSRAALVG